MFASLLRMATKHGFSDVREQLVEDLKGAYPTKWEGYQAAEVLGEDVFGSPKPYPNSVLNLFAEQNIKFALPFAAYRAALGGFSSLTSDRPGAVLPRPTLASTIYGMERIRYAMVQIAHSMVCDTHPVVCPQSACCNLAEHDYNASQSCWFFDYIFWTLDSESIISSLFCPRNPIRCPLKSYPLSSLSSSRRPSSVGYDSSLPRAF